MIKKTQPRLSVNKLGEYLSASASRRRKIIFDAKYPSNFIVQRYKDAETAIAEYYADENLNISILLKHIKKIQDKKTDNAHQIEVTNNNLLALDSFIDCVDCINICEKQNEYYNTARESATTEIKKLTVSVRPEILIKKQKQVIGGLKLYFSKTHSLDTEKGENISTILKLYLEETYKTKINPKNCFILDVFTKQLYFEPASYKRRYKEIELSCEEIISRWNDI